MAQNLLSLGSARAQVTTNGELFVQISGDLMLCNLYTKAGEVVTGGAYADASNTGQ